MQLINQWLIVLKSFIVIVYVYLVINMIKIKLFIKTLKSGVYNFLNSKK